MINIKSLSVLLKITSKLDITPVIDKLKSLDIFKEAKNAKDVKKQLTAEKAGIIGAEIISALIPQLSAVADFLPELTAAYKDISVEEAEKMDAFSVIDEIMHDEGIKTFFKRALQKKGEPKH